MKRGRRLRARSPRREALLVTYDEARAIVLARPRCEGPGFIARALSGPVDLDDDDRHTLALVIARCTTTPTEPHHLRKRTRDPRPENLVDPAGIAALCHRCHRFTETHPRLAQLVGLLLASRRPFKSVLFTELPDPTP